jgi:GAF domain-containing protein
MSPLEALRPLLGALILLSLYGGMIAVLALRRGLRGPAGAALALCLASGLAWSWGQGGTGLRESWPLVPWARIATYALATHGVTLWLFTRAFLQRPLWDPLREGPGVVAVAVLVAVGEGWVVLPAGGPGLASGLGAGAGIFGAYALLGVIAFLLAYVRRSSPLHRNRIVYGLAGAGLWIVGVGLSLTPAGWGWAGAVVHAGGGLLLTYTVLQSQLPHVVTALRRGASYLLATILPAAVTVALGAGVLLLLGRLSLLHLRWTTEAFWGLIVVGAVTASLYHPLNALIGRGADRLLFGRRYETQRVVRAYGRSIEGLIALEDLARVALTTVDDTLGVPRSAMLVVEEQHERGWWLRVIPDVDDREDRPPVLLPAGTPMADWLVEQGNPLSQYALDVDRRFADLDPADRDAWRRLGMELFLPIQYRGALVGLLALGVRRSGQPYTPRAVALLETMANQTGAALENARLFDQARRRADQLALLNEIGRMITASLDLEVVVDSMVERLAGVFPRGRGFIFLLNENEEQLVLRGSFGREPAEAPLTLPLGRGFVGRVAAEGRPALVPDLEAGLPDALAAEGPLVRGAQSALCAPITRREGPLGAILIGVPRRAGAGALELDWLDTVAAFAAVALENARQVAAREARLRRQVETLRIQIDELKRTRQVEQITETEAFQELRAQARRLRRQRERTERPGVFEHIQQQLDQPLDPQDDLEEP